MSASALFRFRLRTGWRRDNRRRLLFLVESGPGPRLQKHPHLPPMSTLIESHLVEKRVFKPSKEFAKGARIGSFAEYKKIYDGVDQVTREILGEAGRGIALAEEVDQGARLEAAVCQVVRRRQTQRLRQLPRPPSRRPAPQQGGDHLGRRAGRHARAHLSATSPRGLRFANVLKRNGMQEGRPRRSFTCRWCPKRPSPCSPAPASARCTAWSSAASRPRRSRTASTTRRQARHHRRRRLSARQDRHAQAERRRGAREGNQTVEQRHRLSTHAITTVAHEGRPRRLVAPRGRIRRAPIARPSRSTASTRCSSSTPAARPENPRASCTPPAATCSAPHVTSEYVFDLRDDDIYWCTADIGWVTGHSYIVYGPLANGATDADVRRRAELARAGPLLEHHREVRRHDLLHRPDRDPRLHEMGRRMARRSTISPRCACSAPSASRSIPKRGCGTTSIIGGERCPIVDTWWQTETGGIMITPLPGATPTKPGTATLPFFGVDAAIVDDEGKRGRPNQGG